ncbi:MAG: tRNA (adenosine(37)-N6)-threonylcarbamoyltransferase complex ATPase subunit type 1 TsaE [Alsobacter sp.]|nr:tRNA (adenosine(37)-N6)-threonylcarbamoyltransferase complex ATPase subunit type 1 TsaE [Burkholderiales bacterium]
MAFETAPRLPSATWTVDLPDEAATARLAGLLSPSLAAGDLVTLSGALGSGKTSFARALLRVLAEDPALDVPSPTFTLLQTYDTPRFPVVHADLYRIGGVDDLAELGWDEAAEGALVLVEWPEKAGFLVEAERLDVDLAIGPQGGGTRVAVLTGWGAWAARLDRARAIAVLLANAGWSEARREFLLGDASTRAYERLTLRDRTAILMIMPRRPDGPPVRMGKPYSAIARLAESVHPFVAMDNALRAQGFSAPEIYAMDLDAGLLLTEDLGDEPAIGPSGPIPERYAEAATVLAQLHGRTLPTVLPIAPGSDYTLPPYDLDAMSIEVELLIDWYMPHIAGTTVSGSSRATFVSLWRSVLEPLASGPSTWILRDYHSPNLIWLADREGPQRVGLIDFQDAVLGHAAYDLVSLLQDARLDVPEDLELKLLGHYARQRKAADPAFAMGEFARAYAVLGAQRATKILGIFARLDKRDGKPQYLRHLPRIQRYLVRDLAHPVLSDLKVWYESVTPTLFDPA